LVHKINQVVLYALQSRYYVAQLLAFNLLVALWPRNDPNMLQNFKQNIRQHFDPFSRLALILDLVGLQLQKQTTHPIAIRLRKVKQTGVETLR
jgi:hypothetical protein